jgi:hypothetical protein
VVVVWVCVPEGACWPDAPLVPFLPVAPLAPLSVRIEPGGGKRSGTLCVVEFESPPPDPAITAPATTPVTIAAIAKIAYLGKSQPSPMAGIRRRQ